MSKRKTCRDELLIYYLICKNSWSAIPRRNNIECKKKYKHIWNSCNIILKKFHCILDCTGDYSQVRAFPKPMMLKRVIIQLIRWFFFSASYTRILQYRGIWYDIMWNDFLLLYNVMWCDVICWYLKSVFLSFLFFSFHFRFYLLCHSRYSYVWLAIHLNVNTKKTEKSKFKK